MPACPSPPVASAPPAVRVAIGGGDPIVATPGSSELRTCSNVAVSDAAADDPKVGLTAHPGDKLTVSVPTRWSIIAFEGSDHPANGDGANVAPLVILSAPTSSIEMPVPGRSGRSIVGVALAIVSASGQVVGRVQGRFQVKVG